MRNLLWIVVAVLIVGGGYMLFTGKTPAEQTGTATRATDEAGETDAGQ